MDAYTSYILQMAETRSRELRREAAEYALSRAARGSRLSPWARLRARPSRQLPQAIDPVVPIPLPAPEAEQELRRTA